MPKAKPTPSVETLNAVFSYDEETGELRWRRVPQERVVRSKVGAVAAVAIARTKYHGEFARLG